ncbi:TPA: hypothetical protein LWG56_002849 [Listeria innocua]|nr:hypothetical protein [Listeria innocua]HBM3796142.1 hypothetical protein [Listeria innocua]
MSREQLYNDNWYEAWTELAKVKTMLDDTLSQAKTLQANVENMNWNGEHYKHIRALLEMVVMYHGALLNSSVELNEALYQFGQTYKEFERMESYLGIKGIVYDW